MYRHTRFARRFRLIALAPAAALTAALILASCATAPSESQEPTTDRVPPRTPGARGIIVIAHGANGTADEWPARLEKRIRTYEERVTAAGGETSQWDVFRVNWPALSDRYVTGAKHGHRLGLRLGEQLASPGYDYEVIHLIGSSLGAHLIHGIARGYREGLEQRPAQTAGEAVAEQTAPAPPRPAVVHSTFLEPFFMRGLFAMRYGRKEFGRYADFAENYFVRREPVLFSNAPLRHAVNFDITDAVPDRGDPSFTYYHDYAFRFYRKSVGRAGPGFLFSPFAQGALRDGGFYDPEELSTLLARGRVIEVE